MIKRVFKEPLATLHYETILDITPHQSGSPVRTTKRLWKLCYLKVSLLHWNEELLEISSKELKLQNLKSLINKTNYFHFLNL